MPVGSKPIRTGNARPCRNSAKARNSSAVFCTRNFFRLFHPGASMRASWRSLATSIATQTTASGILCGLVMVGPSPLVNTEHTHSTGDLRLTMTSMASGRLAPFSHAGPPHSLAKTSSFPRCYGSEFINWHLKAWCESKHIQLTRGRPYKKDDNAHVEQKNWTHVRKLLGWDRYDSPEAVEMINDLYRNELRLWLNLYLPSVKLVKKTHVGSKRRRVYDPPQTPLERVASSLQGDSARVAELTDFSQLGIFEPAKCCGNSLGLLKVFPPNGPPTGQPGPRFRYSL